MEPWLVSSRWNRTIFNQCSKRILWAFWVFYTSSSMGSFPSARGLGHSQIAVAFHRISPPSFIQSWLQQYRWSPFTRSFPICQEVFDVSQIGVTFHGICPPFFIQSWLQQYCRGAFFHSAHCSFSNPTCFGSMMRWCSMIHDRSSQDFPNSNDLCQCQWLLVFATARGTFVNSFRLLWSLCFARKWLNPLSGKILNNDSVSVIVSLDSHPHWGLCDRPLPRHQTFLLEVLRQCAFCKERLSFGSQADFTIPVFGEVSINKYCASLILIPLS